MQKSSAAFSLTRYAVSTTVRFHRFKDTSEIQQVADVTVAH